MTTNRVGRGPMSLVPGNVLVAIIYKLQQTVNRGKVWSNTFQFRRSWHVNLSFPIFSCTTCEHSRRNCPCPEIRERSKVGLNVQVSCSLTFAHGAPFRVQYLLTVSNILTLFHANRTASRFKLLEKAWTTKPSRKKTPCVNFKWPLNVLIAKACDSS